MPSNSPVPAVVHRTEVAILDNVMHGVRIMVTNHFARKVIKIGAEVVRHRRHVEFQLEVFAISGALSAGFLRLSTGIRAILAEISKVSRSV